MIVVKFIFFLLFSVVSSTSSSTNCTQGSRSYCSDRGYCNSDGLTCTCDDYLHYWPSEKCSTWHDGRELSPGLYCYPNTVDQYCSWLGQCNSDGSLCLCFDSEHRVSSDRCFNWYPSSSPPSISPPPTPSTTPTPFTPPTISTYTCTPGDRSFCSNRGYCNSEGSSCICDDYLHYWPSEKCSTWHNGRELPVGMCCYPNTVDQYCSWLGQCNSDGSSCSCFDSDHRSSTDRCFNWYWDASTITLAPTPTPTLSPLPLHSPITNETCLYVTLIDNFGDGWGEDVSLLYETPNITIGGTSVIIGKNGYKIEGCLPKLSYSHQIRLSISAPTSAQRLWEIQWSVQVLSPYGNGPKLYGGYDSSFEFDYSLGFDSYNLESWDGLWVYPEESESCGNLPGPVGCHNLQFQYSYSSSTSSPPTTNSTGGDYHEVGWFIYNSLQLDISDFGIPWSFGVNNTGSNITSSSNLCNTCLSDGDYILRVTGANYAPINGISWSFCGVSGGAMNQLSFTISGGVCIPHLPILTLATFTFNEICPEMPAYPTFYPTTSPVSSIPTTYSSNSPSSFSSSSPTITSLTPSPSQNPTTSHPSHIPTTSHPSLNPTYHPTIALIETPVIVDVNVDLDLNDNDNDNNNDNILDGTSDCIDVDVVVTVTPLGGSVYCAAFPSSYTLSSVWDVINQNHWVSAPVASDFPPGTLVSTVEISICSLTPYTDYHVYCVVLDSFGDPTTSVTDSISHSDSIFTSFYITTSLVSSPSGFALHTLSDYDSLSSETLALFTLSFTLDYPPTDSVTVGLVFYDSGTTNKKTDVFSSPSSYTISQSATGSDLTGFFLVYGAPGDYDVKLEFSGSSNYLFLASNTVEITVLNGGLVTVPILMPIISSAIFDYSGARIIVGFDVPTDFASTIVTTNTWRCSQIFSFYGSDESSCVWIDSMTVVITLNYYSRSNPLILPGDDITLLSNVLKGASLSSSTTPTPYTPSSTFPASIATTHILPKAVLSAPTTIVACQDLVINPSLSSGEANRDWKLVVWKVNAFDGSDVSAIETFLSSKTTTNSPVIIPSSLLHSTTYSISLGLLNFMQDSENDAVFTSIKVQVLSGGPIISLSLSSPSIVNVERTSILLIDAFASLSYCDGDFTIASGSEVTATYNWKVKKNNVLDSSIISTSPNSASFMVSGSKFDLESVYQVSVDVVFNYQSSSWTSSKSVIVFGVESSIKAIISGGMSNIAIGSTETLVLNGLSSRGTNLQYSWSCRVLSLNNYGSNCFSSLGSTLTTTSNSITIPSSTFTSGMLYSISLTVNSVSVIGSTTDSTSVSISVYSSIVDASLELKDPVPTNPFNTQDTLRIFTEIKSQNVNGVRVEWSLFGSSSTSSLNLVYPGVSLAELSQDFTFSQLTTGTSFPLGIHADTLASGKTYSFRLTASQTGFSDRYIQVSVKCNTPPFGGSISSSLLSGVAYTTKFTLSAPYWTSDISNYPLFYQFVYQVNDIFDWSSSYSYANAPHLSTFTQTFLPAGKSTTSDLLSVGVVITDIWSAYSRDSLSITVTPNTRRMLSSTLSVSSLLDSFSAANSISQLDTMFSSFQLALHLLNDELRPDCSNAPNCESIRREECSTISHTCGPCYEGFKGAYGSSNYGCHLASESKANIGESCLIHADCYFGFCNLNDKLCEMPIQSCPLGTNGNVCSGNGICNYLSLQGATLPKSECTVDNPNCLATCTCTSGYGGKDCSFTSSEISNMKLDRELLCNELNTLTNYLSFNGDKIKTQMNYLSEIFNPYLMDIDKCKSAVIKLANYLENQHYSLETQNQVVEIISLFANSSSILSVVDTFQNSVYDGMISGQSEVSFSSLNYRTSFTYKSLKSLEGSITLSAPQEEVEKFYNKASYNLTLPSSGLSSCSGFDDYAKLVLTIWGQSPYNIPVNVLNGNLFTITSFSTRNFNSSSSISPIDEDSSSSLNNYEVNLYVNRKVDVENEKPVCMEYDIYLGTFTPCSSCEVSSYSSYLAQLTCNDGLSYFCPSSSFLPSTSSLSSSLLTSSTSSSGNKIYTLSVVSTLSPLSASDSQDSLSKGVLSFVSVYLFSVLIGAALLCWWDRSDRNRFILMAQLESTQKQNTTFILSAAFDESGHKSSEGVKLSQIAAYSTRGTCLSHETAYSRDQKSLFALNNPLNRASGAVDRGGHPIPQISVQSTQKSNIGSIELTNTNNTNNNNTNTNNNNTTSSIVDLDSLSERQSQAPVVQVPDALKDDTTISTWSDLPISSLLSEHSWLSRMIHVIGRHHKWIRIFTYPSMRKSRLIRFIVAASDLLFIIFTNTVFYSIYYPDNGVCESHANTSIERCMSESSKFEPEKSLCVWKDNGSCNLRDPPFTVTFIVQVCMIVIVFSSIPRSFMQYILEKICAKRPVLEDVGMNSSNILAQEPIPVNAGYKVKRNVAPRGSVIDRSSLDMDVSTELYALTHCDHMSISDEGEVILRERPLLYGNNNNNNNNNGSNNNEYNEIVNIQRDLLDVDESGNLKKLSWRQWILFHTRLGHLEWKIRRARNEAVSLIRRVLSASETGPNQSDYVDMCILQHFILEQVSPITRFALKKDIFEMDHASPGRISLIPWIASWSGVIGVWIFMAYWVIAWSVNNGAGPARAWGLVLGIVIIADMITNEFSQIYFLHMHMTQKLRPQLRDMFGVLSDILEFRVQVKHPRYGGLRVPQHLSPSCRASRSQALSGYLSSHILSLIDDLDIAICRKGRLVTLQEVGLFSWLTLFHPALLNTAHDVLQQATMDLVVPIAWCCFILLNRAILDFSVYLLIGLYIGGFLLMLWFYYFIVSPGRSSKPYEQITISGRKSKPAKGSVELQMVDAQLSSNYNYNNNNNNNNKNNINNRNKNNYNYNNIPEETSMGLVLGSETEYENTGHDSNYLALPITEGIENDDYDNNNDVNDNNNKNKNNKNNSNSNDVDNIELYFTSDIFSGQQMVSTTTNNEFTL